MNDLITDEEREDIKHRVDTLYLSCSVIFHQKLFDKGVRKLPHYSMKMFFDNELKADYLRSYYTSLINKTGTNWQRQSNYWDALNIALDNYEPQ